MNAIINTVVQDVALKCTLVYLPELIQILSISKYIKEIQIFQSKAKIKCSQQGFPCQRLP